MSTLTHATKLLQSKMWIPISYSATFSKMWINHLTHVKLLHNTNSRNTNMWKGHILLDWYIYSYFSLGVDICWVCKFFFLIASNNHTQSSNQQGWETFVALGNNKRWGPTYQLGTPTTYPTQTYYRIYLIVDIMSRHVYP